jgi:hypothetical protein
VRERRQLLGHHRGEVRVELSRRDVHAEVGARLCR